MPRRLTRRVYNVAGPNALWHLDGHHKLIHWGFITHGCIDGYSRLITYLRCSLNNRAETVQELFHGAVEKFGYPSRVRTDKGGENTLVWQAMTEARGEGRGSYIAGPSVHNQRIERLWKDVGEQVTRGYSAMFQSLEVQELLDVTNAVDLFCLQMVFLPAINKDLSAFLRAWNSHPLRTESNRSPEQLYVEDAALSYELDDFCPLDLNNYGREFDQESDATNSLNIIDVPVLSLPLSESNLECLENFFQDVLQTETDLLAVYCHVLSCACRLLETEGFTLSN